MLKRLGLLACTVAVSAGAVGCAASTDHPQVTVYGDHSSAVVAPQRYCTLDLSHCDESPLAQLPMRSGYPLQISLPREIADAPWRLITAYRTTTGEDRVTETYYRPGQRLAVTVTPPDPSDQLTGVEIQIPSSVIDPDGTPRARATWAVRTDPAPA